MMETIKKRAVVLRATYWDAPTLHQLIMSAMMLVLATAPLFGHEPLLHGVPLAWLFRFPFCLLSLAMAIVGIFTALVERPPDWSHGPRVLFISYNVVYFTVIAVGFGSEFRIGTVVNAGVELWAIWLFWRVLIDRKIHIAFVKRLQDES